MNSGKSNGMMMRARAVAQVQMTVEVAIGDLPAESEMKEVLTAVERRVRSNVEDLLRDRIGFTLDSIRPLVRIVVDGDLAGKDKHE